MRDEDTARRIVIISAVLFLALGFVLGAVASIYLGG